MPSQRPDLRTALIAKLKISSRTLRRHIQERKQELLCGPPEALHSLAYDAGLDLTSYLSPEELEAVRPYIGSRRSGGAETPVPAKAAKESSKRARSAPKPIQVTIAGVGDVERLPAMSATTAKDAKTMSEKVYPMLYVFENSARELITALLADAVGPDWWDQVVPRKVREKVQDRRDNEAEDPWHGRRGARLIDYTDLSHLPKIVGANDAWPHFEPIFGRKPFFEELVNDFNVSRRVAAHMNPVGADDVKHLEAAFRKWAKTLKAKRELLPGG